MPDIQKQKMQQCTARRVNRRCADFECKLTTGHNVHVDPVTGTRWSDNGPPLGMRRPKHYKKYANAKLNRQTAIMARLAQKTKAQIKLIKPKKGK